MDESGIIVTAFYRKVLTELPCDEQKLNLLPSLHQQQNIVCYKTKHVKNFKKCVFVWYSKTKDSHTCLNFFLN